MKPANTNSTPISIDGKTFNIRSGDDPEMLEQIKALDDQYIGIHYPLTMEQLKAIAHKDGLLIALHQNKLAGYSLILFEPIDKQHSFASDEAMLYGTTVKKEFRHLGLGSALATMQEIKAKNKGIKKLKLTVRPENAAAVLMRLKNNFQINDFESNYFGDESPRFVMEKNIIESSEKPAKPVNHRASLALTPDQKPSQTTLTMLAMAFSVGMKVQAYYPESDQVIRLLLG